MCKDANLYCQHKLTINIYSIFFTPAINSITPGLKMTTSPFFRVHEGVTATTKYSLKQRLSTKSSLTANHAAGIFHSQRV